jgi:hypothetical protein
MTRRKFKMTKSERLKQLTQSTVICTMVGGSAQEDFDALVDSLLNAGWRWQSASNCQVLEKGPQIIIRPKIARVRIGKFSHTSTKYTLDWVDEDGTPRSSGGQVSDLKPISDSSTGLQLRMINGAVLRYQTYD